jgi:ParB-like chromosome segregation protein Spo0J
MQYVEAPIGSIAYNPYRDTTRYPIDEDATQRLIDSYDDLGNFGTLPARQAKGGYEIAAGHHRLEALRKIGVTKIPLLVSDYDDNQMVEVMTVENSTQRGQNAAALLDSVAAITYRLAKLLLTEEPKTLSTNVERVWDSEQAAVTSRQQLLSGKGIGSPAIVKFAPEGALSRREVESAIAALKSDGRMNQIIDEVQAEVEAELAELEAKKQTPAVQKEVAKKREAVTSAKTAASKKTAPTMSDKVAKVFDSHHHLNAFRKAVEEYSDVLPVENHEALAAEMLKQLKTMKRGGKEVTSGTIREYITTRGAEARAKNTRLSNAEKKRREEQALADNFEKKLASLRQALGMVGSTADSCMSHIIKYGKPDSRSAGRVSSALSEAIKSLQQLQKELSL